jgi:phage terminase small subunit
MQSNGRRPAWLDEAARAEWDRVFGSVLPEGVDLESAIAYCVAHSVWTRVRQALDEWESTGQPIDGTAGVSTGIHPLSNLERQLGTTLFRLARAVCVEPDDNRISRPTRILFLDEGTPE